MYALMGALMFVGYFMMNKDEMETHASEEKKVLNCTGIKPNNLVTVLTLSCFFAIDAMGAAFIVQSFLSFYYEKKYDLHFDKIGSILFICNIISGISGVLSSKMVDRFGAIATIIYTHLPSNIFLLSIAFVQTPIVSIVLLFARFSISQMDVPARQTFVSMVVSSE